MFENNVAPKPDLSATSQDADQPKGQFMMDNDEHGLFKRVDYGDEEEEDEEDEDGVNPENLMRAPSKDVDYDQQHVVDNLEDAQAVASSLIARGQEVMPSFDPAPPRLIGGVEPAPTWAQLGNVQRLSAEDNELRNAFADVAESHPQQIPVMDVENPRPAAVPSSPFGALDNANRLSSELRNNAPLPARGAFPQENAIPTYKALDNNEAVLAPSIQAQQPNDALWAPGLRMQDRAQQEEKPALWAPAVQPQENALPRWPTQESALNPPPENPRFRGISDFMTAQRQQPSLERFKRPDTGLTFDAQDAYQQQQPMIRVFGRKLLAALSFSEEENFDDNEMAVGDDADEGAIEEAGSDSEGREQELSMVDTEEIAAQEPPKEPKRISPLDHGPIFGGMELEVSNYEPRPDHPSFKEEEEEQAAKDTEVSVDTEQLMEGDEPSAADDDDNLNVVDDSKSESVSYDIESSYNDGGPGGDSADTPSEDYSETTDAAEIPGDTAESLSVQFPEDDNEDMVNEQPPEDVNAPVPQLYLSMNKQENTLENQSYDPLGGDRMPSVDTQQPIEPAQPVAPPFSNQVPAEQTLEESADNLPRYVANQAPIEVNAEPSYMQNQAVEPAVQPSVLSQAALNESPTQNQAAMNRQPIQPQAASSQQYIQNSASLDQPGIQNQPSLYQSSVQNQPSLYQSSIQNQPALNQPEIQNQPALNKQVIQDQRAMEQQPIQSPTYQNQQPVAEPQIVPLQYQPLGQQDTGPSSVIDRQYISAQVQNIVGERVVLPEGHAPQQMNFQPELAAPPLKQAPFGTNEADEVEEVLSDGEALAHNVGIAESTEAVELGPEAVHFGTAPSQLINGNTLLVAPDMQDRSQVQGYMNAAAAALRESSYAQLQQQPQLESAMNDDELGAFEDDEMNSDGSSQNYQPLVGRMALYNLHHMGPGIFVLFLPNI